MPMAGAKTVHLYQLCQDKTVDVEYIWHFSPASALVESQGWRKNSPMEEKHSGKLHNSGNPGCMTSEPNPFLTIAA